MCSGNVVWEWKWIGSPSSHFRFCFGDEASIALVQWIWYTHTRLQVNGNHGRMDGVGYGRDNILFGIDHLRKRETSWTHNGAKMAASSMAHQWSWRPLTPAPPLTNGIDRKIWIAFDRYQYWIVSTSSVSYLSDRIVSSFLNGKSRQLWPPSRLSMHRAPIHRRLGL